MTRRYQLARRGKDRREKRVRVGTKVLPARQLLLLHSEAGSAAKVGSAPKAVERGGRAQVQLGKAAKAVAPFRMGSGSSTSRSAREAVQAACAELRSSLGCEPTIVFGTFSCLYDKAEMLASIEHELRGVKFHGATSCTGSMTEQGVLAEDGYGLGLLGLSDEGGLYGVAMVTIGGEPRAAAAAATKKAMEQAGRPAQAPDVVCSETKCRSWAAARRTTRSRATGGSLRTASGRPTEWW